MENLTISPEQPTNEQPKKKWQEPELKNFDVEGGQFPNDSEGGEYQPYS